MDSGTRLRASGSCVAGLRGPLALRLGASCPSQRSVPPPCRPGVVKQARLGLRTSLGGSLRVAWVIRVSSQVAHNVTRSPPDQTHTPPSAGKRSSAKYTRSPSTLSLFSNSPPIQDLFAAQRLSQRNLIRSFPSSEKVPTPIYGHGGSLIHRSTWKGHSPRLNFRFTEFYEVRHPQATPK
jgi:hypothetical protein